MMQEKRNIRLLILLVILLVVTVLVYLQIGADTTVVDDKTVFRLSDYSSIDKILLKQPGGEVAVALEGSRWKVNGQPANSDMVEVLFATLQQAEPKRLVAASMKDTVNSLLEQKGITVSLFKQEELQQQFIAGGNEAKTQAYFKDVESDELYVMVIPGYRVYTSGIFELDETGWKDKYVFNFNWRNFQYLRAAFPGKPADDFEVELGKEYFEVKGIQADTSRLNDFLDAVSLLTVTQYLRPDKLTSEEKTVLASTPVMSVEVREISGRIYTLQLFETPSKTEMIGMVQGNQPAVFNRKLIEKFLRGRDWFLKK